MNIRFVQAEDINDIVKLCELHANFERADFDTTNKSELLSKYLLDNKDVVKCLVVEIDNQIVGYATFMRQFSTWDANFYIYLDCLFLKDNVRGKGLGSQLMHKIKAYAIAENCSVIQWQTPYFNKKAITFYKKLGAQPKTKERFFWNI